MRAFLITILRQLPRIAGIAVVSLILGVAANATHPMQLPLLVRKGQPGLPNWVSERLKHVDTQGAIGLVNNSQVLVIDTRDEADFRREHIPGAISLPYHGFSAHFPRFSASVSRDRPLLIYCYGTSCGLASRVGKRLLGYGYTDITILHNGIAAWKAANQPLETQEEFNEY
jgi:rhodanese-related sulfurtransferase